jgi:hypothetical protein
MRHWVEVCGVGPWFYADRLPLTTFTYRGARHDDLHLSIALANSGDVQLELIQQRSDTPSMYREFLAAGREGLQHWSSWPEDYDAIYRRALASGYAVGQEGDSPRGRFVYFAAEGHPGTVIEMADLTPARRHLRPDRAAARAGTGAAHPAAMADVSRPAGWDPDVTGRAGPRLGISEACLAQGLLPVKAVWALALGRRRPNP